MYIVINSYTYVQFHINFKKEVRNTLNDVYRETVDILLIFNGQNGEKVQNVKLVFFLYHWRKNFKHGFFSYLF